MTDAEMIELGERHGWNIAAMAREAGKTGNGGSFGRQARRVRDDVASPRVEVAEPPDPDLSVEEIIALRRKRFALREANAEASKLIPVQVRDRDLLPIGILHHGDPHLDNPGSDIDLLLRHAEIVRETEGLWATSVGDVRDNWVGRLATEWARMGITASESWKLTEHWIKKEIGPKWLYLVGGNHDAWSGDGDPLRWIASQAKALHQSSEVRVALRFEGGIEVRVNCRHDFDGHSQWNAGHGPAKALMLGCRDHIAIAGHRHTSGYNVVKAPDSGITMHGIRVSTYKRIDRYAMDRGFRDQTIAPSVLTTIDPRLPPTHPDLVKPWWDPEEGADFLKYARKRRRAA